MNNEDNFEVQTESDFDQVMELIDEEEEDELVETTILVDIKGQVEKPGVYEMDQDARLTDVINLAGGFTQFADETQINLAQKVHDEMVIYVPTEDEQLTEVASVQTAMSSGQENKVNINHASKEEIETLSGIGAKRAQAIIDYREENGPFQSVEELRNISGIGEKTVENIKEEVIIR